MPTCVTGTFLMLREGSVTLEDHDALLMRSDSRVVSLLLAPSPQALEPEPDPQGYYRSQKGLLGLKPPGEGSKSFQLTRLRNQVKTQPWPLPDRSLLYRHRPQSHPVDQTPTDDQWYPTWHAHHLRAVRQSQTQWPDRSTTVHHA